MRKLASLILAFALALTLAMGGGAEAKKKHPKLKIDLNAATQVAVQLFVVRRNADPSITAGQVLPCQRKSRLKVECVTQFSRSPDGLHGQNCSYTATIYGTKKGKAFLKATPDVCTAF